MKKLKKVAIILGSIILFYYLVISVLYIAGYRWYRFPTVAMEPTIPNGAHAFGRLSESYRDKVQRFQIAIFTTRESPGVIYAKRVIGLPGERVSITDEGVAINGRKLDLPLAVRREGLSMKKCDVLLPMDSVFVLGDNTLNSLDSRYIGPVPLNRVIGQILFKQ